MSSELAQATSLLTQRDSERTAVIEELRKIEEWKEEGYTGLLKLDVYKIDGLPNDATTHVSFELSDEETLAAKSKNLSHKSLGETVEVFVKNKRDAFVDITVHVELPPADIEVTATEEGEVVEQPATAVVTSAQYSTRVILLELGNEGEERWEKEGIHLGTDESIVPSPPIFHIKMSYDAFDLLVAHKTTQLEEAQVAFEEASQRVKDAKKSLEAEKKKATASSTSSSVKKSEKGKKRSKKSAAAEESQEVSEKGTFSTEKPSKPWGQYAQEVAAASLGLVLKNHAVLLFGAAVAGIYNYGDYASV